MGELEYEISNEKFLKLSLVEGEKYLIKKLEKISK